MLEFARNRRHDRHFVIISITEPLRNENLKLLTIFRWKSKLIAFWNGGQFVLPPWWLRLCSHTQTNSQNWVPNITLSVQCRVVIGRDVQRKRVIATDSATHEVENYDKLREKQFRYAFTDILYHWHISNHFNIWALEFAAILFLFLTTLILPKLLKMNLTLYCII